MNDQQNLARRTASENSDMEDPLEELARIVSGGLDEQYTSRQRKQDMELEQELPDPTPDHDDASAQAGEEISDSLEQENKGAQTANDLEAELMREFSLADFEAAQGQAGARDAAPEDDSGQHENAGHDSVAQAFDTGGDVSLEDQLMAELESTERKDSNPQRYENTGHGQNEASATKPDLRTTKMSAVADDQDDYFNRYLASKAKTETVSTNQWEAMPDLSTVFENEIVEATAPAPPANPAGAEKKWPVTTPTLPRNNNFSPSLSDAEVDADPTENMSPSMQDATEESEYDALPITDEELAPADEAPGRENSEIDLSADFQAELEQMESLRQKQPVEKRFAVIDEVAESVSPRAADMPHTPAQSQTAVQEQAFEPIDLEAEFANAFAKELQFGVEEEILQPSSAASAQEQESVSQELVAPVHDFPASGEDALYAELASAARPANRQAPAQDEPDDKSESTEAQMPDEQHFDDDLEHFHALEGTFDEDANEYEPPQPVRKSAFRYAAIALGVALLAAFTAVGFGYYMVGNTDEEPVEIRADTDPVKVRPDDPGGAIVANQDKAAYERVTGDFGSDTRQESLVDSTEEPVDTASLLENNDRTRSPESAGSTDPGIQAPANMNKAEERLAPQTADRAMPTTADLLAPRIVRTYAVRPDGTVVAPQESANPGAVRENPADSNSPAEQNTLPSIGGARSDGSIAIPIPRPANSRSGNSTETRRQPSNAQSGESEPVQLVSGSSRVDSLQSPIPSGAVVADTSIRTGSVAPGVETASATMAAPTADGQLPGADGWAIQIASQRSAEEAQETFQDMRRKYPDILQGHQMSVQRANIEGRGVFYRVRIMADTRDAATEICGRLKNAGGSCFVTR
jgi:hypothetical protein